MNDTDLLLNVASQHTQLRQVSGKYLGLCPIHSEKTPSFWIYPDRGKYHCYGGCGGGDAIDLHQALTGDTYIEAKKALGLWDDKRAPVHRPRQIKNPWPKSYTNDSRGLCYKAARASIVAMIDMQIIYKGREYQNQDFIIKCLRKRSDYMKFVIKITKDIIIKNIRKRGDAAAIYAGVYHDWFIEELKKETR